MLKKIDHFLRLRRMQRELVLMSQCQSIFFRAIGMVGAVVPTSTLFCGFAFAFDLAAITFTLDCDACSPGRSAGTSVLL